MENGEKKKETVDFNRYAEARKLLGGLAPGYRVDVIRKKPNWCKGYLDRLEITEDDPIELDDIRDDYGGKTINLVCHDAEGNYVGSSTVHFPDPPRKDGRVLHWEDSPDGKTELEKARASAKDSGGSQAEFFKLFLENQNQMFGRITEAFEGRIKSLERPANRTEQPDQLEQLERIGATIERLEMLKGKIGGGTEASAGVDGALNGSISKGVDALINMFTMQQKHKMDLELARIQANAPRPMPERAAKTAPAPQAAPQAAPELPPRKTLEPVPEPEHEAAPQVDAPEAPQLDDASLLMAIHSRFSTMSKPEQAQAVQALLSMVDPDVLEQLGEEGNQDGSTDESDLNSQGSAVSVGVVSAGTGGQPQAPR